MGGVRLDWTRRYGAYTSALWLWICKCRGIVRNEGRFLFNPKVRKFRLIHQMERTISVWSAWPFGTRGAFHSTKIPVWNFGNFTCSMERCISVAQTRPKPPRVLLLWLLSTLIITLEKRKVNTVYILKNTRLSKRGGGKLKAEESYFV